MAPSTLLAEPDLRNGQRLISLPTKDHLRSLTVHARETIVLDLSLKLEGMASLADEQNRQDLKLLLERFRF